MYWTSDQITADTWNIVNFFMQYFSSNQHIVTAMTSDVIQTFQGQGQDQDLNFKTKTKTLKFFQDQDQVFKTKT